MTARDQVITDAARLVQWGRKWFELPELIARMADRPALPDVRRILKENKAAIEKKAADRLSVQRGGVKTAPAHSAYE